MKQSIKYIVFLSLIISIAISGCAATPEPTQDASAIATAAVQTVEARYTEQALSQPTATLPSATPTPENTLAPGVPTATRVASYEFVPGCVFITFVADITIPDGQLVAPGESFTKTWRLKNTGSCAWDSRFALIYVTGDKFGEVLSMPLPRVVYPGQEVDISVPMVAPSAEGTYTSEWRMQVPVGTAGVNSTDTNISVKIQVTNKIDKAFQVTGVTYQWTREPKNGCPEKGTKYTFTANVSVNGPGEVIYRWDRGPSDGIREGGKIQFTEAGTKQVSWVWNLKPEALAMPYRWVALFVEVPNGVQYEKVSITFNCD